MSESSTARGDGSASGLAASGNQFWHQNSAGIADQCETSEEFGWALAAADFNRDGYDDLAITAPTEDLGAASDCGVLHVIRGGANGLTATASQFWHQNSSAILGINTTNDNYGDSLVAGDFDGNNRMDLAIGISGKDVSLPTFATQDSTARGGAACNGTAAVDYVATTGNLAIPRGVASATINVPVCGDVLDEANKTFTVRLTGTPVNATIDDGTGLGTIVDNDPLPNVSVADVSALEDRFVSQIMALTNRLDQFKQEDGLSSTRWIRFAANVAMRDECLNAVDSRLDDLHQASAAGVDQRAEDVFGVCERVLDGAAVVKRTWNGGGIGIGFLRRI